LDEELKTINKILKKTGTPVIIGVLLMFSFIINELAFGAKGALTPALLSITAQWKWLVLVIIKMVLAIAADAFLLWMMRLISNSRPHLRTILHAWQVVIMAGVLTTVLLMLNGSSLGLTGLLNAAFPLMRNVVPFLSGVLLFALLRPYLHVNQRPLAWRRGLLLALIIPLFLGRDVWSFAGGSGLFAALAIGLVALLPAPATLASSVKRFCWLFLSGLLLTALMGVIAYLGPEASLANYGQFIGPLSPFILLPAVAVLDILHAAGQAPIGQSNSKWLLLGSLLLILFTRSSNLNIIMTTLKTKVQAVMGSVHGLWMLVAGLLLFVGILVLTFIIGWLAPRTTAWRVLDQLRDRDFAEALSMSRDDAKPLLRSAWNYLWPSGLAFAAVYVIQVIATLLMYPGMKAAWKSTSGWVIFPHVILNRIPAMFFGTILIMCIFWILRGLTGRYWVALMPTLIFEIVWAIVNTIKVGARNEPVIPADIYEVRSMSNLLGMVNPLVVIAGLLGVVVLIVLTVILEKKAAHQHVAFPLRLAQLVASALLLWSFGSYNHTPSVAQNLTTNFGITTKIFNQLWAAQENGPYTQFIQNLDVTAMAKPSDYSEATMRKLYKKYSKIAAQMNKTRTTDIKKTTVIFNLSESFSDPARVPNLTLSGDPIPNVRAIKKETTSGLMMSYGYGGGTANMEWETLTGMSLGDLDTTLSTPYTQLVSGQKNSADVSKWFNYSSAIHPFNGSEYNRVGVYKKFGFNKFIYDGSKYPIKHRKTLGNSSYQSDQTAYANLDDQLNAHKGGQFINLITMQNHMPYSPNLYSEHDFRASGSAFTTNTLRESFESYAQGIHYTDDAVAAFKKKIDAMNKPIIWVFYGDHLGALYSGDTAAKYSVALHQTDYFVYANKYAREHGAKTKLSNTEQVGSNDFIALAFAQANAKVDPFVALLTKAQQDMPTIWTRSDNKQGDPSYGMSFVTKAGKKIGYSDLTKKQKAMLHDYQLLQYDINAGEQYSLKMGMQK
jgi:phosphoglycerol transferase MdoB-like AlkP superfamily enzyme